MITFFYKKEVFLDGNTIFRPVAEVYLKSTIGTWIQFTPYIDSGADVTLIPLTLGKLIGLPKNQKVQKIGGISGSIPIIYTKADMRVGQYKLTVSLAWAQVESVPPLLGRTDIFDLFTVKFKQKEKKIIFEHIK